MRDLSKNTSDFLLGVAHFFLSFLTIRLRLRVWGEMGEVIVSNNLEEASDILPIHTRYAFNNPQVCFDHHERLGENI